MRHKKLLALGVFALGADTALADAFIEHEKHVHGQAQLNIAIEKNDIEMEFSSPAMNLLGFEYKPSSVEDKRQLAKAQATLRQAGKIFTLSTCQLKESEISSALLESNQPEEKSATPSHDHKRDQQHKNNHSDFTVHYHFSCSEGIPAHISTGLFVAFPGLQQIAVTVLSEQQTHVTLNKSKTVINLL